MKDKSIYLIIILIIISSILVYNSQMKKVVNNNYYNYKNPEKFDFNKKEVKLNNNQLMPIIGFSFENLSGEDAEEMVYLAIKNGCRLIDTSFWYGNELEVGYGINRAIQDGIVKREDLFVTTKIIPYGFDDYDEVIKQRLELLTLDYLDLILIHQKGVDIIKLYRSLEKAVAQGIVKSLGIANIYDQKSFDLIVKDAKIMPVVIQNENHLFYHDDEFKNYVGQYGILIEGYFPLGGSHGDDFINNSEIIALANKYHKTVPQIILRWQLQNGIIVIPILKSEEELVEDYQIFDFEMSSEDVEMMNSFNTMTRYEKW